MKYTPPCCIRTVASRIRVALVCAMLAVTFFANAQESKAADGFISAPSRVDMVYDFARDVLYITNGGSVLRYHLADGTFLPAFNVGASLAGIDLSPDGNTLVVADRQRSADNVWVYVIDLQTQAVQQVLFPRAFSEGGTFAVAFASDGAVLITSTFEGSGWVPLRRYNLATGAVTVIRQVRQDSMVTSSGDYKFIGLEESNISDGAFGRYRVADGDYLNKMGQDGTGWFNFEVGVNKDGTRYALPTFGGTFVYDGNLAKIATIGQVAGSQPISALFHPAADRVFFAWAGSTQVREYETATFTQVAAYDFGEQFTTTGNHAFVQGRLKLSGDGSLLFCTVSGGVRYTRLYAPLTAASRSVSVQSNTTVPVPLTASVGNGGSIAYQIVTPPAHGTLSGTAPDLSYTPEANYSGDDSFAFKATYGRASVVATVSISVTPPNMPPSAVAQSLVTDEDTPLALTLAGSDPEGGPLTYSLISAPTHGTLSGTLPNLTYSPAANYNGPDSFAFKVNDGQLDSAPATVSITVNAVNDAPVANNQSVTTNEDTAKAITLTGADVEGSLLTYSIASGPAHGTLSGTAPNLTYTPAANFNGADSFTFVVSDGQISSAAATVSITINAVNDAPVAANDAASTVKNTAVLISVLANDSDVDGDLLSVTAVAPPANGSAVISGTQVRYTPRANFTGTDSFTYTISDGKGGTATAKVTVTVTRK